jgi:hypothetical protein
MPGTLRAVARLGVLPVAACAAPAVTGRALEEYVSDERSEEACHRAAVEHVEEPENRHRRDDGDCDDDRPITLANPGELRSSAVSHDHLLLDGDRTVGVVFTPNFTGLKFMW